MCDYVAPSPTLFGGFPILFCLLQLHVVFNTPHLCFLETVHVFIKYAGYSCSSGSRCIAVSGARNGGIHVFHTLFCLLYLHVGVSMFSPQCSMALSAEAEERHFPRRDGKDKQPLGKCVFY